MMLLFCFLFVSFFVRFFFFFFSCFTEYKQNGEEHNYMAVQIVFFCLCFFVFFNNDWLTTDWLTTHLV